ncbi:MAG: hypothetical protein MHM6MM_004518 [Cercozoa sp. M6MM]
MTENSNHSEPGVPSVRETAEAGASEDASRTSHMTLADIRENKALFQCFQLFLKRMLCSENVDFLLALQNYDRLCEFTRDEMRIRREATQIYYSFLHDDAPRRINLSAETMHKLQRRVKRQKVQARMFRSAAREITELLETDSIPKFQNSPEYQVWLDERREALRKEADAELMRSQSLQKAESDGGSKRRWFWQRKKHAEDTDERDRGMSTSSTTSSLSSHNGSIANA